LIACRALSTNATRHRMTQQTDTLLDRLGRFLARRLQRNRPATSPTPLPTPKRCGEHCSRRHPADRGQPEDIGRDQISDAVDLVACRALCRRCAARAGGRLGAAAPHRGQSGRRLRCRAAVEIPDLQHAHLPGAGADAGRPQTCRRVHDRSRLGLKYDTKNILDMLRYFLPTPAGTGALAADA
jgi:hypothetical protein